MVFVFGSTFRSTTFGIWSHCSGVGLRRTAPPVAVRTPWWMSSMPAVFSSKNMPLYSFVKTRTLSPRFSKYCLSLIVSGSVLGEGARRAEAEGDREQEAGPSGHGHLARRLES